VLDRVKINGPLYQQIVSGKDLIADILPPPEYIIETYLSFFECSMKATREYPALISRSQQLKGIRRSTCRMGQAVIGRAIQNDAVNPIARQSDFPNPE
jgi:hypothetical protein